MRKKTKKFYFSNFKIKNPAVNSIFCFSKRAFRVNRRIRYYSKCPRRFLKKKKFYEFLSQYRFYKSLVKQKIKYNIWNLNTKNVKNVFINSFFYSNYFFRNHKKYKNNSQFKLMLWFLFKNRFKQFTKQFIFNFKKTGMLSSQFVHMASRKNLSYQVWAKYRSKLFNMGRAAGGLYGVVQSHYLYHSILLKSLYAFTSNPTMRYIHINNEFNTVITSSFQTHLHSNKTPLKNFVNIYYNNAFGAMSINYDSLDLALLLKYNLLVEQFLQENNKKNQQELYKNIETIIPNQLDIIYTRFYIFAIGSFEPFILEGPNMFENNLVIFLKIYYWLYRSGAHQVL